MRIERDRVSFVRSEKSQTMLADTFRACFATAAQAVSDRAEEINRLNVFPVPDGDTGTNMSLTLKSVVGELQALPQHADMKQVCQAITHGSLMGARGNSGVITSQIMRGLSEGFQDITSDELSVKDVSLAFKKSVKVAFQAVRKPIDGTILTVLKDTSTSVEASLKAKLDLEACLEALVKAGYDSVNRTPELLPVLKENGVVDAGGYGLAIFFDNFVSAALGKTQITNAATSGSDHISGVHIELNDDWEGSEFRYCTEFLFHSDTLDVPKAQEFLSTMGDCELLVGSHPNFKLHVHTDHPDKVLGYMLQYGQLSEVHVHNMDLQAHERTEKLAHEGGHGDMQGSSAHMVPTSISNGSATDASTTYRSDINMSAPTMFAPNMSTTETKPMGFVAVCFGEGNESILASLGVDVIVSGGQTMNPSTKDLMDAAEKVCAKQVFILPNNKNIIMAAQSAASASEKEIIVIPTTSIPQSFSALCAFDPEASFEDNAHEMAEILSTVHDCEITTAIKDSHAQDGSDIKAGDIIGIVDGAIEVVGHEVVEVACRAIELMLSRDEGYTITLLAGKDLGDKDFESLQEKVEADYPDLELDPQRGDQPLYPLLFSIE